ncbi:hypothetical protein K469DRAFT_753520 [Zopfia rhizophila CBS 207.26]|uniref:Arrestin-like N-terminal domain-containing protein n=1 Tax=Zopfia rhizophila CBS 207.26 TaxID=1314779 RepID=A0A6A6DMU5_9PEZI|nr:hypothetical protein K469DRAFT_753520 [Zopfia rhizophila CBS 207.26]
MSANRDQLLSSFPAPPRGLPQRLSASQPNREAGLGFFHVGISPDDRASASHLPPASPITSSTALKLVLDGPNRLFAPRETITGYVEGWDVTSGEQVHVILEGRAKSCATIRGKVDYRDRTPLLYRATHLKPDEQGLVPRFEIKIPEKVQYGLGRVNKLLNQDAIDRYWTHEWNEMWPYEHEAGHPLPPSMVLPTRTTHTLFEAIDGWGYIEYKLTAVRSTVTESDTFLPEATFQIPIWLTTLRLPADKVENLMKDEVTATQELSIQTLKLLSERKLSFGEILRDAFTTTSPCFYFGARVTTPKLAVPGTNLEISISIDVLPPPAGKLYNFPLPDIKIQSLSFRIRSYQGLRVKGALFTENRSFTFKSDELSSSKDLPTSTFYPLNGSHEKQKCVVTITLPKTTLPSFKTYNFWRAYRLECEVVFRGAGKEVEMRTQSDLNVVARAVERGEVVEGGLKGYEMEGEEEVISLEMARAMLAVARVGSDIIDIFQV